ncbi:MAG: response regulator transcription factor [Magnetococcales bacterium]|nr:response regulator transcription factor [Magnetococcales bacterium]
MTNMDATVYVVDDHPDVGMIITLILRSIGISCKVFENASSFMESYRHEWSGCILLDVRMPEISGLEIQEMLNTRNNKMPVIFITGHADVPMAIRAMKQGAFDFIEKPFNNQYLLECIQKALRKNAETQQRKKALRHIQARFERLTRREREVLDKIILGNLNKSIADQLGISIKTVEKHRANVMGKMSAASVPELIQMIQNLTQHGATPKND